jgi:hypothetical protein
VNDFRPPEYRRAIVVFIYMTLIVRVASLSIYREDNGVRFTIPTQHSSTVLTQKEAHEVTAALVKLFRKPKTETEK